MEEKKLVKCLLDEKDICTDWIYSEIYDNEVINSEHVSYPNHAILGFFNDCLLETKWSASSNYLDCQFLYNNRFIFNEEDIEKLIHIVKEIEKVNGFVVQYKKISLIDGDVILRFRFFFKEED